MMLVLRALGIGDLCAAVPALRALREATPDEELVLAAPDWIAPLASVTGLVDRVVPAAGLAAGLPPMRPRLAVNLHGSGPQSHRLLDTVLPGAMWGYACPAAKFYTGPRWSPTEHQVIRWCRMLRWYGLDAPADRLDLPYTCAQTVGLTSGVPLEVTVVHPGAKAAARRWPADRFARVAAALTSRGHRVVITGSAQDAPLAGQVATLAGLDPGAVLAGRLDTAELAALVAAARLVVCGDTGVGHLATAYRIPSVLLFGPAPPALWGPPPDRPWHRVLWHGGRGGVGTIQVAEVLAAADVALAAGEPSGRGGVRPGLPG